MVTHIAQPEHSAVVQYFFGNVFQLPKRTPPPPVQASRARWVGVRIHVILLGIVGYVFYGNCTVIINIKNKCKKRTRVFDYSVVTMIAKKNEGGRVDKQEKTLSKVHGIAISRTYSF